MKRLPISLIIDDGAPVNPLYFLRPQHEHVFLIPNSFTNKFADICIRDGIKGKFSVMPMPSGLGRIDKKLSYVSKKHLQGFLNIARNKIASNFDITPELLTHAAAFNAKKNDFYHLNEDEWVDRASEDEITDYLSLALRILKNVGLPANGVTSPWRTGTNCEEKYARAIGRAQWKVNRAGFTWYFLHTYYNGPGRWPWVAYKNARIKQTVVSVPANTCDPFWSTQLPNTVLKAKINANKGINEMLSKNGKKGRIRELYDQKSPIIIVTHWEALFSDGRYIGLYGLEKLLKRVKEIFGDKLQWMKCSEIAKMHCSVTEPPKKR